MKKISKKAHQKTYTEKRPWGFFTRFTKNESSTVKLIFIKAGASLSLQYHHNRAEFWHIISGIGTVTVAKKKVAAKPGKEFTVPPEVLHRISAKTDMLILEIATGMFDETDIVRVKDTYGRVTKVKIKK